MNAHPVEGEFVAGSPFGVQGPCHIAGVALQDTLYACPLARLMQLQFLFPLMHPLEMKAHPVEHDLEEGGSLCAGPVLRSRWCSAGCFKHLLPHSFSALSRIGDEWVPVETSHAGSSPC